MLTFLQVMGLLFRSEPPGLELNAELREHLLRSLTLRYVTVCANRSTKEALISPAKRAQVQVSTFIGALHSKNEFPRPMPIAEAPYLATRGSQGYISFSSCSRPRQE